MRFARIAVVASVAAVAAACSTFDAASGDGASDGGAADGAGGDGGPGNGADGAGMADGDAAAPAILTLAQENARTLGVAVDDRSVYWWSVEHSAIRKVDKDQPATVSTLASRIGQTVSAVAADSSGVYWLEAGPDGPAGPTTNRIMRMRPGDAQPAALRTAAESMELLALDATRVVTTTVNGILGLTKAGAPIDGSVVLDHNGLGTDGNSVYYTYTNSMIYRLLPDGVERIMEGLDAPRQLTFEGATMYGLVQADGGSAIFKAGTTAGGTAADTTAVTQIAGGPVVLAIDSLGLVWANAGDGSIKRVARSGGAQTLVVSGLAGPNAIAADARGVYWTTDSGAVGWAQRAR